MEPVGVRNEGGKVAHERVGRLEEPRSVEADAPGVQAGFFEDFAPHGVFGALAAVDVSGDKDVARAAVLLNEQDAAGLFVCDDHADRRVVHGKAVFAADRAERHDALAFERLFDERRAALPAVFLYHGEKILSCGGDLRFLPSAELFLSNDPFQEQTDEQHGRSHDAVQQRTGVPRGGLHGIQTGACPVIYK